MLLLYLRIAVLLAVCGSIGPLHSQTLGRITGMVSAEEGVLPPGSVVIVHKMPDYVRLPRKYPPRIELVRSSLRPPQSVPVAANGAFDAVGLPGGKYQLCVIPPDGYLENCLWSSSVDVVLPPGSTSVGRVIRLRRGAVVQIRVNDPQSLLPTAETASGGRRAIIGVMTPARAFRTANLRVRDASGRILAMTVPFDMTLELWAAPVQVSIRGPNGTTRTQPGSAASFRASRLGSSLQFSVDVSP